MKSVYLVTVVAEDVLKKCVVEVKDEWEAHMGPYVDEVPFAVGSNQYLEEINDINFPLLKKWVDALRSGKYTQGFKKMRSDDNCRCVLGVLCDVFNPDIWERLEHEDSYFSYDGGWNCPRHETLAKMGLKILVAEGAVKFKLLKAATYRPVWVELLYMLNDGMDAIKEEDILSQDPGNPFAPLQCRKWTFNELADLIEEHIINKYS